MAELKDSGARREFSTGAVRDIADGKGRMDLVPLDVAAELLKDDILRLINNYVRHGDTNSLYEALRVFVHKHTNWNNLETALIEVSKQYEDGARKYTDRNWEKGIPVHCFIDSGVRHYLKCRRGDTDEPHDRAVLWNLLGALWTHKNKPELIDLPFATCDNQPTIIKLYKCSDCLNQNSVKCERCRSENVTGSKPSEFIGKDENV